MASNRKTQATITASDNEFGPRIKQLVREVPVSVRFTVTERKRLTEVSKRLKLSTTDFIRLCVHRYFAGGVK